MSSSSYQVALGESCFGEEARTSLDHVRLRVMPTHTPFLRLFFNPALLLFPDCSLGKDPAHSSHHPGWCLTAHGHQPHPSLCLKVRTSWTEDGTLEEQAASTTSVCPAILHEYPRLQLTLLENARFCTLSLS